jgi:diguanylate cyclase (GGDEF)-like protein
MDRELSKTELENLIYTDELTRIHNLRYLREQIPVYLDQEKKQGNSVAFLLFDIDDFKNINDSYGHLVGDKALAHFISIVGEKINQKGIPIRYAGDEFVVIMPQMDKQMAKGFAEEIQKSMADTPLEVDHKEITIGCSIGVSLFPQDGESWKILFEKADEALYAAKEQGKSKIVINPDSGKLLTPSKLNSILDAPYIVGRDALIQFLEKHLSDEGSPQSFPVLLGGEGAGKTRIMKLAREIAQENLAFTLYTKGYPYWQSDLYGAVFGALSNLFDQKRKISDHVFSRIDDKYKLILTPHIPPWYVKEAKTTDEAGETDNVALFEALTQTFFILRELGEGAVLLDDVDQIDIPSLQFLGSQFGHSEKGGSLHFVSSICSPELTSGEEKLLSLLDSMPELTSGGNVQRFELDPLNDQHVQQLVAKLFNGKTLLPESAEALLNSSSGNPLFIVEALSVLLLEGKVSVKEDEWDLSSIRPEDIPKILPNMIKTRIKSMDKEALHVLKMASILGERINPLQLAEISKLKLQQVLNALSNAQRALLIEECINPGEYVFAHRIIRSVLYSLMSEGERRQYHAQAVKIEKKYAARSPERIVGRLAYHFHNAGQLEKAAQMFSALKNQMDAVYISKGSRKILKKRIHSVSMAKESPLETEDLSEALMIGRTFRSCIQNLRLYPKENENVKNSLQQFMNHLTPFLEEKTEALSLSVTLEAILFNGNPLPPYLEDKRLTQDLYVTLNSYGLQGVLFMRGIVQQEVVRFLEIFKRLPEEVIGQWDVLLEQLGISNILPDRKIFVAVSERKVNLDERELYVQPIDDEDRKSAASSASEAKQMTDGQIEQLKKILGQFSKEKQELIAALKTSEIREQDLQHLVQILNQSNIEQLVRSVQKSGEVPVPIDEAPPPEGRSADKIQDRKLIKDIEADISLAFEDLSSEDSEKQAHAASLLVRQEPDKLAEAGLRAITSDIPFKVRRIVAGVIKKAGKDAVDAFLGTIHIGMHYVSLIKVIRICDIFTDHPGLVQVLREIALNGPVDTIPPIVSVLKLIPGKEVDMVLLEIFERTTEKMKEDIIPLFAERKILEAVPLLIESIKPVRVWETEQRISLQQDVCRTLGVLRSLDAREALITAAQAPRLTTIYKTKPDSIRAAATWALTQLPRNKEIEQALAKLKNDRSHQVRKAVELAEILHK